MSRMKLLLVLGAVAVPFAAPAAQAQSIQNLKVHGYLNQGFAQASDLPVYGITKDVTGDYRRVALQFRYDLSDNDAVVVQVGNMRLGNSPLNTFQPGVQVDWAFAQHQFKQFNVRAGRMPLVEGIYNQTRSVGTLLPFYRAPGLVYIDGKETIDGGMVSTRQNLGGGWSIEPSAGIGTTPVHLVFYVPDAQTMASSVHPDLTGWLWLNTPIEGVRLGYGGEKFALRMSTADTATLQWGAYQQWSADASFQRVYVRAEARKLDGGFNEQAAYVQAGVAVAPQVWLNVQDEWLHAAHNTGGPVLKQDSRDEVLGVTWKANPNVALKLEGHAARGYQFDHFMPAAGNTKYFIASVAASF